MASAASVVPHPPGQGEWSASASHACSHCLGPHLPRRPSIGGTFVVLESPLFVCVCVCVWCVFVKKKKKKKRRRRREEKVRRRRRRRRRSEKERERERNAAQKRERERERERESTAYSKWYERPLKNAPDGRCGPPLPNGSYFDERELSAGLHNIAESSSACPAIAARKFSPRAWELMSSASVRFCASSCICSVTNFRSELRLLTAKIIY